jgi:hypothetical protein
VELRGAGCLKVDEDHILQEFRGEKVATILDEDGHGL